MSSSGRDVDSVVSSLERTPNSGYNSNNDVGGGEAPHSVLTSCKVRETRHVSSMIPSARPTVPPLVDIIFM